MFSFQFGLYWRLDNNNDECLMEMYADLLAHIAFALMLMNCLLLAPQCKENRSVSLFVAVLLCGSGYLLGDVVGPITSMSILWWLSYIAGNALPGIFWLVSLSIFAERHELKAWQYYVASLTLIVPLFATLLQLTFSFDLRELPGVYGLVTYGAMLLELVLICHALFAAIKHWQADLVQERRYMRGSVISLTATYLLIVIVAEQLLKMEWVWLDTVKHSLLVILLASINVLLFQLREGTLFDSKSDMLPKKPITKSSSPELQKILDAMVIDKLYQEEGITISALSRHLSIHEYKLRQLINGELAYRNFNDFLNFYRIQEIAQKLECQDKVQVPVLTLALESGFRSLSSFNKAFKATHGVTPTEYRNMRMTDSLKS